MLPDPKTGKMYYANLRTKETRWDPPPGFGASQSSLNPAYNPQVQFQHSNAAVWRTASKSKSKSKRKRKHKKKKRKQKSFNEDEEQVYESGLSETEISTTVNKKVVKVINRPHPVNNLSAYSNQQQLHQNNQYMNAHTQPWSMSMMSNIGNEGGSYGTNQQVLLMQQLQIQQAQAQHIAAQQRAAQIAAQQSLINAALTQQAQFQQQQMMSYQRQPNRYSAMTFATNHSRSSSIPASKPLINAALTPTANMLQPIQQLQLQQVQAQQIAAPQGMQSGPQSTSMYAGSKSPHSVSQLSAGGGQDSAPMLEINPLTAEMLQDAKPAQKKRLIGERLFPKIQAIEPRLAGKITGMLLEMDNTELLVLLSEQRALMNKINEALSVLKDHQQKQSQQNPGSTKNPSSENPGLSSSQNLSNSQYYNQAHQSSAARPQPSLLRPTISTESITDADYILSALVDAPEFMLKSANTKIDSSIDGFMRRMQRQQLYQELESTKEYQETYWYGKRYEDDTKSIIPLNKFWCDFGIYLLRNQHDDDNGSHMEFLSKWILLASSSIHEIICCLAVLDLPFISNGPKYDYNVEQKENVSTGMSLKLKCDNNGSMVFIKQIVSERKEADTTNDNTLKSASISINVSYFDPLDPYQYDNDGTKFDKFINPNKQNFYSLKVYCCLIIVTNSSSIHQDLKIFTEIPSGSIPCGKNSFYNKTHYITISSYSTHKIKYYFYFPSPSTKDLSFHSFPIIVSKQRRDITIAWSKGEKLNVTSTNDIISRTQMGDHELIYNEWMKISANGNHENILSFLSSKKCNLARMKQLGLLQRICYLFNNKDSMEFWRNIIAILDDKNFYDPDIYSYSLKYKDHRQSNLNGKSKTAKQQIIS